jgi:DNA modification methylase
MKELVKKKNGPNENREFNPTNVRNTVHLTWANKFEPKELIKETNSQGWHYRELITRESPISAGMNEEVPLTLENISNLKKDQRSTNIYFHGDNLIAMQYLIAHGFSNRIKCIYIDPPFYTGETFHSTVQFTTSSPDENRSFIQHLAYSDEWQQDLDRYLAMLYPRIRLMHELLAADGAFFLHCDQNASHYLKVLCDEIFGRNNFRNEIFVKRIVKNIREHETVPRLNNVVDSILFYAKSPETRIIPPPIGTKGQTWHAFDAPNIRPNLTYPILGIMPPPGRHWMWTKSETDAALAEGRIRKTKTGTIQYLIGERTQFRNNLWDDITGYSFDHDYPTEKKVHLIATLIEMVTETGDWVADFFAGSGTTLESAEKGKRNWIGADASIRALLTTKKRWYQKEFHPKTSNPIMILTENAENIRNNAFLKIDLTPMQLSHNKSDVLEFSFQFNGIEYQNGDEITHTTIQNALCSDFMALIEIIELGWLDSSETFHAIAGLSTGFGKNRHPLPKNILFHVNWTGPMQIIEKIAWQIQITDIFGKCTRINPNIEFIPIP